MSIQELKQRLADVLGIDSLSMTLIGGRAVYSFNGKIAALDPMATDAEVEQAIRNTAASSATAQIPIAPIQPKASSMAVTGAGAAGQSLKSLMAKHRQMVDDAKTKLEGNFAKLAQAAQGMNKLGDGIGAEADELIASLAEFTNDVAGEA